MERDFGLAQRPILSSFVVLAEDLGLLNLLDLRKPNGSC